MFTKHFKKVLLSLLLLTSLAMVNTRAEAPIINNGNFTSTDLVLLANDTGVVLDIEARTYSNSDIGYLLDYYKVDGQLREIAQCESGMRHYDFFGNVLLGRKNPKDTGLFQINTGYHLEASKEMGLDIFKLEGNIQYALWLYETGGTKFWSWSARCWN